MIYINLILSIIIFYANADLGTERICSHLGEQLLVEIPFIQMESNADYESIKISLATPEIFKRYGLVFTPELGLLRFRIIEKNDIKLIQVTSNKPINSPVLSLLIYYKLNKDEFYRQYTFLLDPIYGISNKTIEPKPPAATIAQEIAPLIYVTTNGDTLYKVSNIFTNKSQLNASQVFIALGLINYKKLYTLQEIYESGVVIQLANPEDMLKIDKSLADEYFFGKMNDIDKLKFLRQSAEFVNKNINIDSPDLFQPRTGKPVVIQAIESKNETVLVKDDESIVFVNEETGGNYLSKVVFSLLSLMLMLVFLLFIKHKNVFKLKLKNKNKQPQTQKTYSYINDKVELHDIVTTQTQTIEPHIVYDENIVKTLEHILTVDDSRDDIRIKLLELYLLENDIDKSNLIYSQLKSNNTNDVESILSKYNFAPIVIEKQ